MPLGSNGGNTPSLASRGLDFRCREETLLDGLLHHLKTPVLTIPFSVGNSHLRVIRNLLQSLTLRQGHHLQRDRNLCRLFPRSHRVGHDSPISEVGNARVLDDVAAPLSGVASTGETDVPADHPVTVARSHPRSSAVLKRGADGESDHEIHIGVSGIHYTHARGHAFGTTEVGQVGHVS